MTAEATEYTQPRGWAPTNSRATPDSIRHFYTSDAINQLSVCRNKLYKGYRFTTETPPTPCPKCLEKVNQP